MWGIEGYRPQPVATVADLLARHGDSVREPVGRPLTRILALCYVAEGERCPTLPVVLEFGDARLELAADGFDRLFVSRDALAGLPLPDTDDQDDPELEVAWADLPRPEVRALLGATVGEVRVLEGDVRFTGTDGDGFEAWLLGGLEFVFADGRALQVAVGGEALDLTVEAPDAGPWRRTATLPSAPTPT